MNKQKVSKKTESKPELYIAKTRDDAHEKMKLGEDFEAPSQLSKYNKSMIEYWADKYNYKSEKSRHGYHIYKPPVIKSVCEFCDETYRVQEHCLCEKCRKLLGD